eukprot:m.313900 g.313900  ORF g.313900 m.313900 type:complete len:266 (+) comp19665_c0_seq5:319-1116(+)
MEKHGIGTDASIPVHINNICERNYVKVESDRRLVPTELGVVLVHGYYKIDQDLVLPTMRSALERQLDLIAAGKADFEEVLLHAVDIFQRKFAYFEQHVQEMDELFSVSFTPLSETGKALTRCGQCMRYMKLVQAKPVRLHCQTCNETYSMPQNGKVVEYKGLRCPLDNFEMVMWTTVSTTRLLKAWPSILAAMHVPTRHASTPWSPMACVHASSVALAPWSSTPQVPQSGEWHAIDAMWSSGCLKTPTVFGPLKMRAARSVGQRL